MLNIVPRKSSEENPAPLVQFVFQETGERLSIRLDRNMIIGRSNPHKPVDIDLGRLSSAYQGVSRQHIEILWDGTQIIVRDLKSRNGTMLNGIPLEPSRPYPVPTESELRLGKTRIAITLVDEYAQSAESIPTTPIPMLNENGTAQEPTEDKKLQILREENARLRDIIAEQALKIQDLQSQMENRLQ